METPRAIAVVFLRLITMLVSAGTIPIMISNSFELSSGEKIKYSDIKAYRYVLAASIVVSAYSLIKIPFELYYAVTGRHSSHRKFLGRVDFVIDKLLSFYMASGVGVGYGVSTELKRYLNGFVDTIETTAGIDTFEELRTKSITFFDRGYLATHPLLAGLGTMTILTIVTSIWRK